MTNHPSRNWRSHMKASVLSWLESAEARVLIEVPIARGREIDAMTIRIRRAYEAGYHDGRKAELRFRQ